MTTLPVPETRTATELAAIDRILKQPALVKIASALAEDLWRTRHTVMLPSVEDDLRRKMLSEFLRTSPYSTESALRIYPSVIEWVLGCVHVMLARLVEQRGFAKTSSSNHYP